VIELFALPLAAGLCIALVAAPYGCFLIWGRMAFFGDTLAHAALPGVAIAIWLQLDITATLIVSSVVLVLIFHRMRKQASLPSDTLLAVIAQGGLAIGILGIVLSRSPGPALETFLIGDLLTVGTRDLLWITSVSAVLALLLIRNWNNWLAITINEDLALIDGLAVQHLRLLQLIATAVLVALSIRTVGVLLVSALLIIPAASVRKLASSPEAMAIGAMLAGGIVITSGIGLSWLLDAPAGPSVVLSAVLLFVVSELLPDFNSG